MKLLNRLERSLSRVRVQPFFKYLIFAMAGILVLDLFFQQFNLIYRLAFIRDFILRGEVWRLFTFLIIPPSGSILQAALTIYFYYFIGNALEARWGARRFLLYYLIGAVAAIIAGMITGIGTNQYLNLSMFFAFAIQYPDFQLLLFFVLPIKVKWLALLNALLYIYGFIQGHWVAQVFSLINLFLFFGGDLYNKARLGIQQWQRRQVFKKNSR